MKPLTERAMGNPDILSDIINQIKADEVPTEFILMAKIRTYSGKERLLSGPELEIVLRDFSDEVEDVRIILDVKAVRDAVIAKTEEIFAQVAAN